MIYAAKVLIDGVEKPCALLGGDSTTAGNVVVLAEDAKGVLRVMSVPEWHVEVFRVHPAIIWHGIEALEEAERQMAGKS